MLDLRIGSGDGDKLDWAHLGRTLATLPQYSALQRLHFILHCHKVLDGVESAIRSRVSELDARGIVEVSSIRELSRPKTCPNREPKSGRHVQS
jgi:hypothetical protein